jgi:FkbM family methyltransferase
LRWRRTLGLDWLSDRVAPYVNVSGRKPISMREEDGLRIFSDGDAEIAGLAGSTGRALRHGVVKRIDRLVKSYGIDRYISIRPGDVVVNCGANTGILTLGLARRGARVLAVEPDPTTLRVLRRNVGSNPAIEILPVGLWNADCELTFYQAPESADTSAINQDGPPVTITAYRLDTIIKDRGIARLRLLAGDAEGAEPEVVEGATETLAHTDYFAMECGYERRGERTLEKVTELLKARGFAIAHVTRRNRLIAKNRDVL